MKSNRQKPIVLSFLILLSTIAAFPSSLRAQSTFDVCDIRWQPDTSDSRFTPKVLERYRDHLDTNNLVGMLTAIKLEVLREGPTGPRRVFAQQIDTLMQELAALNLFGEAASDQIAFNRFKSGQDQDGNVVLFPGTPDAIPCGALGKEEAIQLRTWATTITNLLDMKIWAPQARTNLAAVNHALTDWQNYLNRGAPMLLWESYANQWLFPGELMQPPRDRLILLHPFAALSIGPLGADLVEGHETMSVHLLGYARYTGRDYTGTLGLSGVVSFSDNSTPAYGFSVLFLDKLTAGLIWRQEGRTDRYKPHVELSLDFLSLFRSTYGDYATRLKELHILNDRQSQYLNIVAGH